MPSRHCPSRRSYATLASARATNRGRDLGGSRLGNERICSGCGRTRLSRYNPSRVCSACLSASRRNMILVPEWLWDSTPLRHALANTDLGAALVIIRSSAGLSQADLAGLIGWDQSAVARVENGTRDTLYDIRKLLALADALGMPREALAPLLLGSPGATIDDMEDHVDRREFSESVLSLALAGKLDRLRLPEHVGAPHVRYIRATSDRLRRKDQEVGGAGLLRGALLQYRRARRMLDESDYNERIGRELLSATGDLAVCVGWLSYDASKRELSRQLYSEALLLANEGDDEALKVRVLDKMSMQSAQLPRAGKATAREAVRLAEGAAELSRRKPSSRLHAIIAARAAVGYASLGDRSSYQTSIARAWREIERGNSVADPAWVQFVTPQEISIQEARGRAFLGDHLAAVDLYQESLQGSDLSPRNRANYRAQLSAALATAGDLTQALKEGSAVLPDLEKRIASPRTAEILRPLRTAAEQMGVAEFCIRYDRARRDMA
jgi:transcriptional regulator with XRE-family HTH domain